METFAVYSYSASTCIYALFIILSLFRIKKEALVIPFVVPLVCSLFWSGYIVFDIKNETFYIQDTLALESLRNLGWFFFLSVLISKQQYNHQYRLFFNSWHIPLLSFLTLLTVGLEYSTEYRYLVQNYIGFDFRLYAHIGFAVIGLVLVEQLYRNAIIEQRWAIKFLCLGLASVFTLDFILYSKSLLFNSLDISLWEARGFVNTLAVPMVVVSLYRLNTENLKVQISNDLIFHTSVLLGAGAYLLIMSFAGYYIKIYGGSWGAVAQISFISLAILLLLIFFASGKIRALARVYFSKHFFQHRYNYRDEWIKLSKRIAKLDSLDDLFTFIVSTMATVVDSSGGGIWVRNNQGSYYLAEEQNLGPHNRTVIAENQPLIHFLQKKQWIIDFVEYFNDPEIYMGADVDQWHKDFEQIWLIIPLFQQNKLLAFVVLTQPKVPRQIDWDDHDLLKTLGMQLANALALNQASDDLTRSRQFEAYNRFSSFLVHDLKNLVAQVSLIVKNSEKHKRNPEFIDDSIETLENVVKKIEHILGQLKKGQTQTISKTKIDLNIVLKEVGIQQAANLPALEFISDVNEHWVLAEKEKMVAIVGHLVQNAQEATEDDGFVQIKLHRVNDDIELKIIDSGCGMDELFIQKRLFKPFDTTKGNAGMGIGVYEALEYILQLGGKIEVDSSVGQGTTFTICLPEAR